jgi:hypothetical protein
MARVGTTETAETTEIGTEITEIAEKTEVDITVVPTHQQDSMPVTPSSVTTRTGDNAAGRTVMTGSNAPAVEAAAEIKTQPRIGSAADVIRRRDLDHSMVRAGTVLANPPDRKATTSSDNPALTVIHRGIIRTHSMLARAIKLRPPKPPTWRNQFSQTTCTTWSRKARSGTLDCEDEEFGPDSGEPAHGAGKALAGKHLPSSLAGTTPVFNPVDRSVMSGK